MKEVNLTKTRIRVMLLICKRCKRSLQLTNSALGIGRIRTFLLGLRKIGRSIGTYGPLSF